MPFASPAEFACALSDAAAGIAPLPPLTHQRPSPGRERAVIAARLTDILRAGARELLARAIEIEVNTFLASTSDLTLPDGRARLVRTATIPG